MTLIAAGWVALLAALLLVGRPRPTVPAGLTPQRSRLLVRALASLPAGTALCAAEVGADEVRVRAVGPEDPPAPWRAVDDGAWAVASDRVPGQGAVGSLPPGLFRLGLVEGRDLLVDLGRAPGLVSVGGDPEAARAVVLAGVRDLLDRTRPAGTEVTMVDSDLDAVLAGLPAPAAGDAGAVVARVAPPRSGRLRLLVLWRPPDEAGTRRLHALVEDPGAGVAAICVGDAPGARWRLAVDRSRTVDLGVLGPVAQGSA